jgi:hypothetical protein
LQAELVWGVGQVIAVCGLPVFLNKCQTTRTDRLTHVMHGGNALKWSVYFGDDAAILSQRTPNQE